MDTDMLRDESTAPADIPGLVAQARAAYQQNRIKECLALTKAALLVDPGNTAALEMQSAVRFDMQRDLSDARSLIEESRNKPEAQKYRKAAEIILLKALYLDPDSEGAKTLLSSIRSASESPSAAPAPTPTAPSAHMAFTPPVVAAPPAAPPPPAKAVPPAAPAPPVVFAPPVVREPLPIVFEEPVVEESPIVFAPAVVHEPLVAYEPPVAYETPAVSSPSASRAETIVSSNVMEPELSAKEPIPFTVGTSYIEKPGYMKSGKKKESRSTITVLLIVVAIAVIGGSLLVVKQKLGTNAAASTASENNLKLQEQTASQQSSNALPSGVAVPASEASSAANSAQVTKAALTAALNVPPALPDASAGSTAPVANTKTTTTATGSLAVSSALGAEIYMGDKHLGSTPTTLQLPAGNQTIEYRHGDLRSVVTHVIKARETTTALVTFDAIVQLNARPWANVSIEGSPRLPLGQTPLSDVRLPVGSVLVFENPNFPSKSHKIVSDDKAIQMVFP